MPNQRSEDQVLLPFTAKEEFVDELDKALRKLGRSNRSQFIRDAIQEKLIALGIHLPKELSLPPDRIGKGGPRKIDSYKKDARAERRRKSNSKSAFALAEQSKILDAAEDIERKNRES